MRALILCALLGALLFGLRRAVAPAPPPVAGEHLRELVPAAERGELRIAGVSIEGLPQGERFVYTLENGVWRCATVYDAIALSNELEALVGELVTSWGEVVARGERARAYGIGTETTLRVRLHGPDFANDPERDVRLDVELGGSLPGLGAGRGFLRVAGSDEVLEIDHNPRARLVSEDPERKLPPMLDERLLAGEFPSLGEGIERAFIDYADGRSIEVTSRVLGPAPAPDRPPPREWIALEGERTARCLPYRIGGWQSFLYRVEYIGLSDPAAAARRGLDAPVATITLLQVDSAPVKLVIGRAAPTGATFVLNEATGQLCLLGPDEVPLLLADVDGLCSTEIANPWETWLPR